MTELRGRTAKLGNCERLLIRLSVRPSLKYSVLGSPVTLVKGNTASESSELVDRATNQRYALNPSAPSIASRTARPVSNALLCRMNNPTATSVSELAPLASMLVAAAGEGPEGELKPASAAAVPEDAAIEWPEFVSLFRRCRSARMSAA